MSKKKITIDDLAVIMKEGFDNVEGQIQELKEGQEKLAVDVVNMKEDLKNCATKDDLKALEDRVDNKINNVLTAVDTIAKKHEDHETEHVANLGAHNRFEKRITRLEKHTGLKTPATA